MQKLRLIFLTLMILITSACVTNSKEDSATDEQLPYQIESIATGLQVPWEMDVAPDGRIFFTERPGFVRVIQQGNLIKEPVISFESPFLSEGEGGLLGLVLDPQFTQNHYIYVYQTYKEKGDRKNRVLRLVEQGNRAKIDRVLIADLPGAENHNGGRIKIGPDGFLYITTGDRYEPPLAQDRNRYGGKILRIHLDGSIPKSNPFPNSPVYSLGHRNPQGLAWHPQTKQLYSSEHGQFNYDEINLIKSGNNYGWPLVQGDQSIKNMQRPLLHSGMNTWAPSGMTFVTKGPWQGSLLVAALRGEQLLRITLSGEKAEQVAHVESLFKGQYGRIRNIVQTEDGSLYLLTNNRDGRGTPHAEDDQIIHLKPRE